MVSLNFTTSSLSDERNKRGLPPDKTLQNSVKKAKVHCQFASWHQLAEKTTICALS